MKKIITMLFGASLLFATSAYSAGMVGVKFGMGEIDAESDAYTAGSNTYAAASGSGDSQYGAIFAEIGVSAVSGLSLGVEYIPFEANIRLDKDKGSTGAAVSDATTAYVQYMMEAGDGSFYAKAGYFTADVGSITGSEATINSQDDTLEGPMVGVGVQKDLDNGLLGRLELTYTDLDSVSVTTTSNGSTSVKKTGDGDITTISFSIAKSF